ncbi:hypothetical protein AB1Y20_008589 [Prymnesium parvum]|uniref:Uncharacterized protein n=1 Tax=Prymnesium parvum TaxID=97485 RepID=A0AB34IQY0_PRYPA
MQDLKDASEDEQIRLMDSFFDWRKIKGKWKKRSDWHVCSFATDGIKLCITFATGNAPAVTNVPCLVKAGYQIPTPDQPVDAMQIDRGLYHVREDNMHRVLKKVATDSKMRITAIDPGVLKPIEAASVEITGKQTWTTEKIAKAALETIRRITEAEWKRGSDRSFLEEKEKRLRQSNAEYDAAIRALGGEDADGVVAKRTVDEGSLRRHMAAWFTHLPALRTVLLGESRCKIRWVHERKETSYIDTACDAIMERSTLRVAHEIDRRRGARRAPGAASRALEDVQRCVDERRNVYAKNKGAKHAVFMGDGTFSHSRGHISIPKKRLVKALAHRGMCILVQEAYTSKRCPCGTADLKTTSQSSDGRFRCHETPGPDRCCICDEIGEEQMDRDFLAVVNLLYIAFCVLRGGQWPPWLAKNDDAST